MTIEHRSGQLAGSVVEYTTAGVPAQATQLQAPIEALLLGPVRLFFHSTR